VRLGFRADVLPDSLRDPLQDALHLPGLAGVDSAGQDARRQLVAALRQRLAR